MDLHTHYMDLIHQEHQKLRTLKTRPWAFSQWLLSKGEAEGRRWLGAVSYLIMLGLYTAGAAYFFFRVEPTGEGFRWAVALVMYALGAVVVCLLGWIVVDEVFALLKRRSVVPASAEDMKKIAQCAEMYDWFREVVVNLLVREGTGQLTQLQAKGLLYHYNRLDEWSLLEATRALGMKDLEEKTGVVSQAQVQVRGEELAQSLPAPAEDARAQPRF